MSTHAYDLGQTPTTDTVTRIIADTATAGLPTGLVLVSGTGVTLTYDPDLSPAQVTTLDGVIAAVRSGLTPALYQSVRTDIQLLRDLRQLGRNAFMQLDANERDRRLYDAQTATTKILLAILRE